ncbi:MAG: phosphoenolpyruvate carboxylase [Thermodesulfovibrionales bacterium]|jgi:phosphoenolpyruvate carboxylase|nr:phosphoenolpyruvate carboxylase [Thermodesulfovibrionales bacterium]
MKIPRVMSTQHPDNVLLPFFAESQDMSGDDEIQEAYYAFSHLGCDEQMWDCEGKEVDDFVVRKLLTKYEHFFQQTKLGEDVFLTLRVPNPDVEKEEAKVLIETLESIPRSCDAARLFYGKDIPPIFEVILPMTMSSQSLNRIYYYYKDFVVGKQNQPFYPGDITISEWIGECKPEEINVIPLFEDKEHQLEAHNIMRQYLKGKGIAHQRVFIARSDPAMNYGMVSAILCNKIALQRLRRLSEETGVKIYPILGAGSAPFRGHLAPNTIDMILEEYPDVQTFTIQSAFKYDHPVPSAISAINKLKASQIMRGYDIDEGKCIEIIDKVAVEYKRVIEHLAPIINYVAGFVPRRRMRKLHVGLFGYARSVGKVTLPRVISFCAACYSIGLPPEILGLNVLTPADIACMKDMHVNFMFDMKTAMSYFNEDVLTILPDEVKSSLKLDWGDYKINPEHKAITSRIVKAVRDKDSSNLQGMLVEAAHIRKFLG